MTPASYHPIHARHMSRAFELARLGLGRTSPNPAVGCVIVRRGRVIAEGFHLGPGEPHAEAIALRRAGRRACGADVYVTLEPCCHFGRTPGCAQALAAAGVRRVFYSVADPDPNVAGRGDNVLQAAGIQTVAGVLEDQGRRFYAPYFHHRTVGLPWVAAKMAASLDGKIATVTGQSQWISCENSRELVHRWRDQFDAVMVGVGTVLADDPALTCRRSDRPGRHPIRVIVDSSARTPPNAAVVTGPGRCIIAVVASAPAQAVERLEQAGAEVWGLPASPDGHVDLAALARRLAADGIITVLLEGGPTLLAAMLAAGLVNELLLFYAPMVLGGTRAPGMVGGAGVPHLSDGRGWQIEDVQRVGSDILVRAVRCSQAS